MVSTTHTCRANGFPSRSPAADHGSLRRIGASLYHAVRPARVCHLESVASARGFVWPLRPLGRPDNRFLPVGVHYHLGGTEEYQSQPGACRTEYGGTRLVSVPDRYAPSGDTRPGQCLLLVAINSLADFGNPMLVGGNYHVLATEAYAQVTGAWDMPMGATLSVFLVIPTLIVFLFRGIIWKRILTLRLRANQFPV